MPGILFSAYQKFYSALQSLEQFDKEKDFFENISNLDKFFVEFRSVTFVLQKAIAHTDYINLYEKNRNEYLSNLKWFVDKRNEVTKQKPFELVKQIEISVYRPNCEIAVLSNTFTVEDDVELASLLHDIKEFISSEKTNEVFFSAKFSFYEKKTLENLYEKLMSGIHAMNSFLSAMKNDIGEKCYLCDSIENKIKDIHFILLPRDILFDIDYVYYPLKDEFERGGRIAMILGTKGQVPRVPLSNLDNGIFAKVGNDYFEKFILMNTSMKSADLMPTMWIIYTDGTFTIEIFHSDIKTTMYRKINEWAEKIIESDIKEIYCMMTYSLCDLKDVKLGMTSKERIVFGKEHYLTFVRIDEKLNEEEIVFAASKLSDLDYMRSQLCDGKKKRLYFGRYNLTPIVEAFKKRKFFENR